MPISIGRMRRVTIGEMYRIRGIALILGRGMSNTLARTRFYLNMNGDMGFMLL